jgi:hypothetical protein
MLNFLHAVMKARHAIPLLAIALLVIVILLPRPKPPPPEPSYGGLTLTELAMLNPNAITGNPRSAEARAAIRKIGTNSLPCLLAWLSARPNYTPSKRVAQWFLEWLPEPLVPKKSLEWACDPIELHFEIAAYLFGTLGPQAAPAIPDLERLACDPRGGRSAFCAKCILAGIGPEALPALQRIEQNSKRPHPEGGGNIWHN